MTGSCSAFAGDTRWLSGSEGVEATPGVVGALSGPSGVGPEAAGALILLHTTFASDDGAQRGYQLFSEMKAHMLASPGFLHWFTFGDGPNGYALGLWRTPEEAETFVRSDAHLRRYGRHSDR